MKEYIEREAVKERIHATKEGLFFTAFKTYIDFDIVSKAVLETPAADVEPVRHGEWLEETEYYADDYSECNVRKVYACSLCGRTEKRKEPYCHCGAKMDGGKVNG